MAAAQSAFGTAVKGFRDESAARIVRIDVLLLLAVLGLMACSVYTLGTATEDDIQGSPHYYVIRQAVYGGVGITLMLLVARFDYSRLRELKLGLYGVALASIGLVFLLGAAARGSRRWIELPFFRFQPSELGKVLLILALSAFVIDRIRRLHDRETTSRVMLLALIPAIMVVAQPDLGSGLVYLAIVITILFVAGTPWTHFAGLAGIAAAAVAVVLVAAPAVGVAVLKDHQEDPPAA